MKQKMQEIRFAVISLALIFGGWIWVGLFEASFMNHLYAASWWVKAISFCCYLFPPLAVLFAVGGLLFDGRKSAAIAALVLSLASAFFVFYLRPQMDYRRAAASEQKPAASCYTEGRCEKSHFELRTCTVEPA